MKTEKRQLRAEIRASLPSAEETAAESLLICQRLLALPEIMEAKCPAAYVPMKREADIRPVIRAFLARGIPVALPVCMPDHRMIFRQIGAADDLASGAYGIAEPKKSCPVMKPEDADIILIPLEGADRTGHRLGKGGGYYDRWLPETRGKRIGIALREQICENIPFDENDIPLELLVTPDEALRF